ncbi:MAG TPA: AAA family ATPase [Candidatus Eremiobacteraceae bacterium]|nr:AAA family ATPase [Candidatus Eremiobacteraceae bacterium]
MADPPPPFVGQQHVVDYFARLGPQRLAQAYLLHGPRGTGKRTFARMLAWTLNCEHPTSFPLGYCGVCGPCVRGLNGSSGDILEIDVDFIQATATTERKTDKLGMDQVRAIIERMQLKSYEGGRPICIVPGFDAITTEFVPNVLLKQIEEPGPQKLFMLTVEREDAVLPTIRSRCTSIRFDRLTESDITRQLIAYYDVAPDLATTLARRSLGSLGDALAERDSATSDVREAARAWVLDCLTRPDRLPLMVDFGKEAPREVLDETLRQARITARDVMLRSISGDDSLFDIAHDERYAQAQRALGRAAAERSAKALGFIDEAILMAHDTHAAPATIYGWLQVQLRSLAAS